MNSFWTLTALPIASLFGLQLISGSRAFVEQTQLIKKPHLCLRNNSTSFICASAPPKQPLPRLRLATINMLLNVAALLPLVIGLFSAKNIDVNGAEGYRKHETAVDRSSWSYSDTDSGLNGVCSMANKCGPATWSKVNVTWLATSTNS